MTSEELQQRLEQNLRERLPTGGLMMFMPGWKQKTTPALRRYYQLAVSARPIDVTDCGLWQTPVADDAVNRKKGKFNSRGEPKLSGQAAMWATPRALSFDKSHQPGMNGAMASWIGLWPTPRANDGTGAKIPPGRTGGMALKQAVQTEGKGSLNPAFTCWLMGYPIAWENCAGMVMRSSRKSGQNSLKQQKE